MVRIKSGKADATLFGTENFQVGTCNPLRGCITIATTFEMRTFLEKCFTIRTDMMTVVQESANSKGALKNLEHKHAVLKCMNTHKVQRVFSKSKPPLYWR